MGSTKDADAEPRDEPEHPKDQPEVERARARPRAARQGTKQAQMIDLLERPEDATIEQIAKATGWQHHTIRGAISGALKKKLGLTVTSEKRDDGEHIYRIAETNEGSGS
jgi:hypothetical protein